MSLAKNLQPLTNLKPRQIVSWDKHQRISRNQEIWADPKSVVHRLPHHYQQRYWKNLVSDASPVHYEPPQHRFMWDPKRRTELEMEEYPIRPVHTPEMDKGLWGGEGVVKGYKESRPYTKKKILPRHWIPRWYFPNIIQQYYYSEVLDKYFKFGTTPRSQQLIDDAFGLDLYLLTTPEIDINSNMGMKLKREILMKLAKADYFTEDDERHNYIKQKYAPYTIPLKEAEWVGLRLNQAAMKQQDIEDNTADVPEKYRFEQELLKKLEKGEDVATQEADFAPKKSKSIFGEKLLGPFMKPIEDRVRRY